MNSVATQLIVLCVYFFLFVIAVMGLWSWQIVRRKQRPPLAFKLLRSPGESLRRKVAKFDEQLIFVLLWAALAPIIVGLGVMQLLVRFTPRMNIVLALVIVVVPVLAILVFAARFVMKRLTAERNCRLGYLGERAVGEALTPLIAGGYRVFHDVPAEAGEMKFNVDHVVVGPNGVFAIETKTRRKGRAREGFEAHKVAYDGRQLIWPWAEDSFGLKNAEDRARWLTGWLNKMTGLGLAARPMLVLPGWYVVPKGIGPVLVVNEKMLFATISRGKERILSDEQIDLIARQLDLLCRDIED